MTDLMKEMADALAGRAKASLAAYKAEEAQRLESAQRFAQAFRDAVERTRLAHATQAPEPAPSQTPAARDVLAERERQQSVDGWTHEQDDDQADEELLDAAFCYAKPDVLDGLPIGWPWAPSWWKPTTRRHDLVKAGALILAEIERIDRAKGGGDAV